MPLERTVWSQLTLVSAHAPGTAAEVLRPYRQPLIDYARGRGLSTEEVDARVGYVLGVLSDPSFVPSLDPLKVRFRPLLFALLSATPRQREGWTSIHEGDKDPSSPVVEVPLHTHPDFDRLWRLHLLRRTIHVLSGESPRLGETASLHYIEGQPIEEIPAKTGRPAALELQEAEGKLEILLGAAIQDYTVTTDQFEAEVEALSKAEGTGAIHDLGRRLLAALRKGGGVSGPPGFGTLARKPLIGTLGFVAVLVIAALVVTWNSYELRNDREELVQEREKDRLIHEAELRIEAAASFVYEGRDAVRHDDDLRHAIGRLRELRPSSPALAKGLCRRIGAGHDPGIHAEAMEIARGTPEGDALAWDYRVYTAVRERVWREPSTDAAHPAGPPRRIEADNALLAGEDERALDLYLELQLERRGDPQVWLGAALSAFRLGSYSMGIRFAQETADLLDVGREEPREGRAVSLALEGLCLEKLGRTGDSERAFRDAARRATGNTYAQALLGGAEDVSPAPAAELPKRTSGTLHFRPVGEPAPEILQTALEVTRKRLLDAGLLSKGDLKWDPDARRLAVSLPDGRAETARAAEWLVTRKGLFSVRDLAPRAENDRWRHPSTPAGHEWAPLNLFYPDVPRIAGRYRLLKSAVPMLTRDHLELAFEKGRGRLVWSCNSKDLLPGGARVAFLLDGEIFWYGRVGDERTGTLTVGADTPQALIPIIFKHGPLPVHFVR